MLLADDLCKIYKNQERVSCVLSMEEQESICYTSQVINQYGEGCYW